MTAGCLFDISLGDRPRRELAAGARVTHNPHPPVVVARLICTGRAVAPGRVARARLVRAAAPSPLTGRALSVGRVP